ncbi:MULTISPECIES: hypothetical protein [Actinosynnema]|uniref:hypothetical protein n=1 Tax=Actinosynnema TaxID=40566 RepID=UPI0020A47BBE|nr:hypothetical protein [Actinosynnema pretiosum]MCP2098421.1 hypothetical protein [Actinosynnema pretiosum]
MNWNSKVSSERSVAATREATREAADLAESAHQRRAALVVADHAVGVHDCRELLTMLGLSDFGAGSRQPVARVRQAEGAG